MLNLRDAIRPRLIAVVVGCVMWCHALASDSHGQTATTSADAASQPASQPSAPLTFTISYDSSIADSFTGRVYIMLATRGREPRFGPSWFGTEPFFAIDVTDWRPDQPLVVDDRALAYPARLSELPAAEYSVQAVMRRNTDSSEIGSAVGNAFSEPRRMAIDGQSSGATSIRIDREVEPTPFIETDRIRLIELRSDLLSEFHGRDVMMRAAVILPPDYQEHPDRLYPALYWIGGFGSSLTTRGVKFLASQWDRTGYDRHIIRVVLDPSCYGGHHVFADSDNNGPRGSALIREFIPFLEKTHRLMPESVGRFVSGHSSGGWSSLWLQVTYPEIFDGAWSIAPDPVDFRDFQQIDLYAVDTNMYLNQAGERRPLARMGERIVAWYEDFARMETVVGEGGQLRSFEWVFSSRGIDGKPEPLYDRDSGAVNPAVAESWKRFDIRLVLERNWTTLAPKLKGKLHIFTGDMDTFYLEGAVRLLRDVLTRLGSDATVEIVAGKDHGSIATPGLRERIDRELIRVFESAHPELARPVSYD